MTQERAEERAVGATGAETDDIDLVRAAKAGHDASFAVLVDRWLDRCWDVAWRILRDRDMAADTAQETMVTAWQRLSTLEQDGSFGGWVLRIARNRALNRLERERRAVATGDDAALEPTDPLVVAAEPGDRVERAEQVDLVWAAASALGERDASVLDLHLRHGMGPAELADELGVTANNAHQMLFRLRNRLGGAIRAHVLWHRGDPRCDDLTEVLRHAGITSFGPAAVKVIDRHAQGCPTCESEQAAVLAPAALFAAVPIVVMPTDLRERLVASLAEAGVPAPGTGGGAPPDGGTGPPGPEPPDTTTMPATEAPQAGGPGTETSGAAAPGPAAPGAGRARVALVAALMVMVLVLAGLVLLPGGGDDPIELATPGSAPTTTAAPGPDDHDGSTLAASPPAPAASIPAPTSETPPDVAPPTPAPEAPPVTTVPTVAPPPPTTSTTTTEAPAATVVIHRFEAEGRPPGHGGCDTYVEAYDLVWDTEHARTVVLAIGDGPPQEVAASGSMPVCGGGPFGSAPVTATLTAIGHDDTTTTQTATYS